MISTRFVWTVIIGIALLILLLAATYVIPLLIGPGAKKQAFVADPIVLQIESPTADIVIEPFHRTITEAGENQLEIHADRAEINQKESIFRLRNIDRTVFHGNEGRNLTLRSDEGYWDQNKRELRVSGNVAGSIALQGDPEPVEFASDWVLYAWQAKRIDGGDLVSMNYGAYRTQGRLIGIDLVENTITLTGDVISHITADAFESTSWKDPKPILITARQATYDRGRKLLEYNGQPQMRSGDNILKSHVMRMEMENRFRFAAEGDVDLAVKIKSSGGHETTAIRVTSNFLLADVNSGEILMRGRVQIKQPSATLSAEDIRFQLDKDAQEVIGMSAHSEVFYRNETLSAMADHAIFNPVEDRLIISGNAQIQTGHNNQLEAMIINIFPNRRYYSADDQVSMRFIPPGNRQPDPSPPTGASIAMIPRLQPGIPITAQCRHMEMDENKGLIILQGDVRGRQDPYAFGAEIVQFDYEIQTGEIISVHATGNVNFAQANQVITADILEYQSQKNTLDLEGNAMFWQDSNQIRADRFQYRDDTGEIYLVGHVDMTLENRQSNPGDSRVPGSGGPIRLKADQGVINDREGKARFLENIKVEMDGWIIKCSELQLEYEPLTRAIYSIIGLDSVEIQKDDLKANGSSLTYNMKNSIITLRGSETEKCSVWTGERGSHADQIDIYLMENRVVIEQGISMVLPSTLTGSNHE
ncbi:LPS export ABC transporter periplasmic protein LptC [bacterium]|nr:LPS export ABC transporter periplasmic protein LptC [candidate division CSSED10-310 bacterium]